jgi:hypothetical protein
MKHPSTEEEEEKDDETWQEKRDGEWMSRLLMASGGAVKLGSLLRSLSHFPSLPSSISYQNQIKYWWGILTTGHERGTTKRNESRVGREREWEWESHSLSLCASRHTWCDLHISASSSKLLFSLLFRCFIHSFIHSVLSLSALIQLTYWITRRNERWSHIKWIWNDTSSLASRTFVQCGKEGMQASYTSHVKCAVCDKIKCDMSFWRSCDAHHKTT